MTSPATTLAVAGALWLCVAPPVAADPPAPRPARSRTVASQALPAMDGSHLRTTLVEVSYEPGGASASHSHPCPVIVYVLDGAIRTQVKGEPEAVYRVGDTFREAAGAVHMVSANASQTAPARFLAMFVCDHDAPLSAPTAGGK